MAGPHPTTILALRFSPGRTRPASFEFDLDSASGLERVTALDGPVALLVPTTVLERLALHLQECRLLRPKHPAKSLKTLLLDGRGAHDGRIPCIDGRHRSVRQLKRSISTFLRHAANRDDTRIFFVGAAPRLFDEMLGELGSASPVRRRRPGAVVATTWAQPLSDASAARKILELLPDFPIPGSLVTQYVGRSIEVQAVRRLVVAASRSDLPVLILGESGTGKELVAKAIHHLSGRPGRFEPVNCGTFPPDLLESELFGHVAGTFTGARRDKPGLWETAENGTLFLDEIAELRPDHQAKLLRALGEMQIRRVGGLRQIPVNARIVCASNRDLFAMVRAGRFREDLYYRVRRLVIRTPSLRSHPGDLEDLAQYLWAKITRDGRLLPRPLVQALRQHTWPGNVRELKSTLEALHSFFGGADLTIEKLHLAASYAGCSISPDDGPSTSPVTYRSDCLRQLLRADEVLRASEVAAQAMLAPRGSTGTRPRKTVRDQIRRLRSELELLTLHPLHFHTQATYDAFVGFQSRWAELDRQLQQNRFPAPDAWITDLAPALKFALSALFGEVQRVLQAVAPRSTPQQGIACG